MTESLLNHMQHSKCNFNVRSLSQQFSSLSPEMALATANGSFLGLAYVGFKLLLHTKNGDTNALHDVVVISNFPDYCPSGPRSFPLAWLITAH